MLYWLKELIKTNHDIPQIYFKLGLYDSVISAYTLVEIRQHLGLELKENRDYNTVLLEIVAMNFVNNNLRLWGVCISNTL